MFLIHLVDFLLNINLDLHLIRDKNLYKLYQNKPKPYLHGRLYQRAKLGSCPVNNSTSEMFLSQINDLENKVSKSILPSKEKRFALPRNCPCLSNPKLYYNIHFQAMFDMAYELGARTTLVNRQGLTTLTLAAQVSNFTKSLQMKIKARPF